MPAKEFLKIETKNDKMPIGSMENPIGILSFSVGKTVMASIT